jgi:hypothetical protein
MSSMAPELSEGAHVVSLGVNDETTAVARRYAEEAGVADRIGDAGVPCVRLPPAGGGDEPPLERSSAPSLTRKQGEECVGCGRADVFRRTLRSK